MVIDWRTQIDECIRFTKIIPTFHASVVEQKYQQMLITKKLVSMGYDNIQILNWFILAEDNCIKDEWDIAELVKIAHYRKWPRAHNFKIYITQKEIEHIQKLKATKECKSYLLSTVAFCKMMKIKKKKATFNLRERAYIYYLATGKDNYNVGTRRQPYIQNFIKELENTKQLKLDVKDTKYRSYKKGRRGGSIQSITNVVMNASWIDWNSTEGYELTNLESQMKSLCDKCFENDTILCSNCGKIFLKTSKMQRTLCDECYRKNFLLKDSLRKKAVRTTKTKKWTEEENKKLLEIYSTCQGEKMKEILIESFPDRTLKEIYNRANYLGVKKWSKTKKSEFCP